MIVVRPKQKGDWLRFVDLADEEGWRVPLVEHRLFGGPWSDRALALDDKGRFGGLVTAVKHDRTGWIGNLIVPVLSRGSGYGSSLFSTALDTLLRQGVNSIWLTASEQGRGLYEKSGFAEVDQIERWVLTAEANLFADVEIIADKEATLLEADRAAWGDDRQALLEELGRSGKVCCCDESVALLQKYADLQIIGPWYSPGACPRANRLLLQKLLSESVSSIEVVADVVASSPVKSLLSAVGFVHVGQNALMAYGDSDAVDLSAMVALASLGSIG